MRRQLSALFSRQDAEAVLQLAGDYIWHSMRKYEGNPGFIDNHPLSCGCTYCN